MQLPSRESLSAVTKTTKSTSVNSLKAILVDWATAQIEGLKRAVGEERAEELLRGCQVSV